MESSRPVTVARWSVLLIVLLLLFMQRASAEEMILGHPQIAGMSMFRAFWDRPVELFADGPLTVTDPILKDRGGTALWTNGTGAIALDALNRSVLIRFPEAADRIADKLRQGAVVTKAELVLPFRDEELWPVGNSSFVGSDGYDIRKNWGVDALYRGFRPEWHVQAWLLRRPWVSDRNLGPTFNANVNGRSYWTRYGASDEREDRFPGSFGPVKVSWKHPEGRMDVTPVLNDPSYGATLGERLRTLADCGFLLRKVETYDHRYFTGYYEWATACGGRAIVLGMPRLEVAFDKGNAGEVNLPPPPDIQTIHGGKPTAVMPTTAELEALAAARATKPAWMPEWQWKRVRELLSAQDPEAAKKPFWYGYVPDWKISKLSTSARGTNGASLRLPPSSDTVYGEWVDGIIGRQPRGWSGFESSREMTQWYLYGDALPAPARDAVIRYWSAWLMPDRETAPPEHLRDPLYLEGPLVHNMVQDDRVGKGPPPNPLKGIYDTYWEKTGDWRGNKSYFRSGFCWSQSTQNFNTTASAGALVGGEMIGSERAMADGRHGIETFPLRMYCWSDGTGQEHLDHYYFALTLAGNKVIADYSPTPYDRLVGQSLLAKNIEELAGAWHPGLRSLIAGSSRTSLDFLLGSQDGLQHILHTLSPEGALRDYGTTNLPAGNISTYGHDVPPGQIALQTLSGPWAPEWMIPMISGKQLPFEGRFTGWGGAKHSCYLGSNYGLAVNALANSITRIQIMGQWRREPKTVTSMTGLGTLDLRCGAGTTLWVNDGEGRITPYGTVSAIQDRGTVLALTSPRPPAGCKETSLQSSIALFNFSKPDPDWEIYADGKRITGLPYPCKAGSRITIRDGVSWIGIIPLASSDNGRDAEVILEKGVSQKAPYYKSEIAPALVVNSYNIRGSTPLTDLPAAKLDRNYGGFVVTLADVGDYPTFKAFQKAFGQARLEQSYDPVTNLQHVVFSSGEHRMEASTRPGAKQSNLVTALVNGISPDLPQGLERDTPYCQQGLGRVEKRGAVLEGDPGHRLFLQHDPVGDVVCAWNPLPDLGAFHLTLPGGMKLEADGKVGLTRVVWHGKERLLEIDSRYKPGQENEQGIARQFLLTGAGECPRIVVNGIPCKKPSKVDLGGREALAIPML
jgi:hypothetical protein